MDTEDDKLKLFLGRFPSNFKILAEVEKNPKSYLQAVKNKLEQECEEYDMEMETLHAWNLISFLCFVLGEVDLAVRYNTQVLEKCPNNIIGVCNKAWIYFKQRKQFDVVQSQLKLLDILEQSSVNVIMAEAEIAFSLSRFGMPLYEQAQKHFKNVLEKCSKIENFGEGIESSFVDMYPEEVCVWKFGLALTQKRMLNINNIHDAEQINITQQKYADVAELYVSIINMKSDKRSVQRYKARAYVEIGLLADTADKNKVMFPDGVKNVMLTNQEFCWTTKDYFENALKEFDDDVFVLERCGKYFRYANEIDRSVKLLEQALNIRETSFAHHHLALSLKKTLEKARKFHRGNSTEATQEDRQKVTKNLFSSQGKRDAATTWEPASRECVNKSTREPVAKASPEKDDFGENQDSGFLSFSTPVKPEFSQLNPEAREFIPNRGQVLSETVTDRFGTLSLDSAIGCSLPEASNMISSHKFNSHISSGRGNTSRINKHSQTKEQVYKRSQSYNACRENWSQRRRSGYKGRRFNTRGGSIDHGMLRHGQKLTKDQMTLMAMIKSPRKPKFIDGNKEKETVEQIHYHFDKAIELSGNCAALYDKGILYRQTEQPFDALTIFEKLVENKDKRCSLVQLSNAYEQAGLCMYFILMDKNRNAAETLPPSISEYNMKGNFKRSIEISCLLVSKIPMLKHCWASAPTLQSLLRGTAKTKEQEKERLKDLSFLHTKLENYSDAIEILKELRNLAEDVAEKVEVTSRIVLAYLNTRNYDDAVLALDLIMCLPDGYSKIDGNLYIKVHLEGGMEAMRKGHTEMARLRFGNMFDFGRDIEDNPETQESNDSDIDIGSDRFDVFILCDEDNEDSGLELASVFEQFGIKTTVNIQNVLCGSLQSAGYENAVKCSKHMIVVYDIKPENKKSIRKFRYWFDLVRRVLTDRGWGNIVIVSPSSELKLPTYLADYKTVNFDLSEVVVDKQLLSNDFVCEKVKEILTKISAKECTSV